jgi:ANTAR domain/GAF domain
MTAPTRNFPLARLGVNEALAVLAASAASNVPGAEFASVTVRHQDQTLETIAATDELADRLDAIQYELREGPCYAAVTDERFVLVNDLQRSDQFSAYGPRAVELGLRSQLATQIAHNGSQAGLNVYARRPDAFDRVSVQIAEMLGTHVGVVLGYAREVETLGEALHTRQDIGAAVGIVMERYGIDRDHAFEFLVRICSHRNVKLRAVAAQLLDGTFQADTDQETR